MRPLKSYYFLDFNFSHTLSFFLPAGKHHQHLAISATVILTPQYSVFANLLIFFLNTLQITVLSTLSVKADKIQTNHQLKSAELWIITEGMKLTTADFFFPLD